MRRYRPLRGVRVLSFEAAFSLPAATRVLSELGADVVRVGRPAGDFPPFVHRTDGSAINKRSVSANLHSDAGRELAFRLAVAADVVCNNFRPRFLRGAGITVARLWEVNPGSIVLQLSGYGTPGPWQEIGAFGPSVEAAGGMDAAIGQPEDGPTKVGSTVFADQTAGRYAALAVISALERRRRSGRGRAIDLSMYEGIAHIMGDRVLGAARSGRAPAPIGNRGSLSVPQGIYPCAGDNEWVAIAVAGEIQWQALFNLLAASLPPDAALPGRLAEAGHAELLHEHDRIDAAIAAWTATQRKETVAETLQGLGIAAGPVQKVSDMLFDPQLQARGAFQPLPHDEPVLGYRSHPHLTLAWRVQGYVRPPLTDARPEGADNRAVLRAWLGLSAREVRALEQAGALLPPRLPPVNSRVRQSGEPLDPDFAERLKLEPAAAAEAAP